MAADFIYRMVDTSAKGLDRHPLRPGSSQSLQKSGIISPVVDILCCGGLSIVVVVLLLGLRFIIPEHPIYAGRGIRLQDILLLSVLINFPHFMASYRILYRKVDQIKEHGWAAIYAPLILGALIIYALLTPSSDPELAEFANGTIQELLMLLAGMLLAWHYTGQAWGMTASFLYIGGIRMEDRERKLIRSGFYALMVLHLIWACLVAMNTPEDFLLFSAIFRPFLANFEFLFLGWSVIALLTIPIGIYGFWKCSKRTGQKIPKRALVPWIAIYFWYFLIAIFPGMFLILQIFHALQYLIFPIRVEINQQAAISKTGKGSFVRGLVYYVFLVAIGIAVFFLPNASSNLGDQNFQLTALVTSFVNIHHYVIDGAIWKIRNPDVRRDLFAHLAS